MWHCQQSCTVWRSNPFTNRFLNLLRSPWFTGLGTTMQPLDVLLTTVLLWYFSCIIISCMQQLVMYPIAITGFNLYSSTRERSFIETELKSPQRQDSFNLKCSDQSQRRAGIWNLSLEPRISPEAYLYCHCIVDNTNEMCTTYSGSSKVVEEHTAVEPTHSACFNHCIYKWRWNLWPLCTLSTGNPWPSKDEGNSH